MSFNFDALKKIMEIKEELGKKLSEIRVESQVGGGMVKVLADGMGKIVELKIAPEAIEIKDISMLESLIIAAVNDAKKKAQDALEEETKKVIGFRLPGFFDIQ